MELCSTTSSYCLSRQRLDEPSNQVWDLVFSDVWSRKIPSQLRTVEIVSKPKRAKHRVAAAVKMPQHSNISALRRQREYHEQVFAGAAFSGKEDSDKEESEEETENETDD